MALYKLQKDERGSVRITRDGKNIGLHTNVYDFGITSHGWGGAVGAPQQISFAIAYDVLQNKDQALATYEKFEETISDAAPFILELSTNDILGILNS